MILAIIKCYDDDRSYLSYKGCWYVDCHLSVPVLILNHDGVVVCGVVHHVGQVLLRRTAAAKAPGVLLPQLHRVGHIISVTPLVMELVLCMSRSWTAFSQLHCGWLKNKISSTTFTLLRKKGRNQNSVSHRGLTVQTCIQSDHPLNCQMRVKSNNFTSSSSSSSLPLTNTCLAQSYLVSDRPLAAQLTPWF